MKRQFATYQCYLVRFWRMDNAGHPVWRASLEKPGSEQELYFERLADLYAYLTAQLEEGETGATAADDTI